MPHALPALRPSRRLLALLLAVLAVGALPAAALLPQPAAAQLIDNTPETPGDQDAEPAPIDGGGSVPLAAWLGIAAALAIGGAAFFILRDASTAVGDQQRPGAPVRKPVDPASTRGVPKTMFEGEGSAANPRGRAKKREKGKRQKAARRANRPKR